MNRLVRWLIPVGALAVLGVAFPPISLRSRAEVELAHSAAQFNARDFVARFWTELLASAPVRARDAGAVLTAIAREPADACADFGRSLGIGGTCTFFLRGTGRVVGVTEDEVRLAVEDVGAGDDVDVLIPLGLVFGNAVRDASGLLDSSAFPNAQQFNDVAAGLNAIVETQVLPELPAIAQEGAEIEFVGCAELAEGADEPLPLRLVPVSVSRKD